MKKIVLKNKYNNQHINAFPEDVERMVKVMAVQGYDLSDLDACRIWERYSEDWCAGWLVLPKEDSELVRNIMEYAEAMDE